MATMKTNRRSFLTMLSSAALVVALPIGKLSATKLQPSNPQLITSYFEFDSDGKTYRLPVSNLWINYENPKNIILKTEMPLPYTYHEKFSELFCEDDIIPIRLFHGTREFNFGVFLSNVLSTIGGDKKLTLLEIEMISSGAVTVTNISVAT